MRDLEAGRYPESDVGRFIAQTVWASDPGTGHYLLRVTGGGDGRAGLWKINDLLLNKLGLKSALYDHPPAAGDVVKIVIPSSGASNKFEFFKNGQLDGAAQDVNFLYDLSQDNWAGVALRAHNNNAIDDFTLLLQVGAAANMIALSGNAQADNFGRGDDAVPGNTHFGGVYGTAGPYSTADFYFGIRRYPVMSPNR